MPHLVRIWNFLPDINGTSHGSERYWQFNSARQDGFIACARAVTGAVPAACGVGSPRGAPLMIYFLASATAPSVIENPRQVSAYHYPPAYSPRSPTFSRACVVDFPNGRMLFISGTASILGHATVHIGDAAAQTRETLRNIERSSRRGKPRGRRLMRHSRSATCATRPMCGTRPISRSSSVSCVPRWVKMRRVCTCTLTCAGRTCRSKSRRPDAISQAAGCNSCRLGL